MTLSWDLMTKVHICVCIFASLRVCMHIAIFYMFILWESECVFLCVLTHFVLYVCRGVLCVYVLLCDCEGVCVFKMVSWDFNV